MDFKRLKVHPSSDDAGEKIGEVVHELDGSVEFKPMCGMPMFEATFKDTFAAQAALDALAKLDCVSHVGWVETT